MNQTELRRMLNEKAKKGMRVQEVFKQADPMLAAYAFMVSRPFNEGKCITTLRTKAEETRKLITYFCNEIERISKLDVQETGEYSIYIWEKSSLLGQDEGVFVYHDAIALRNEDIEVLIDCDCNLWDEKVIKTLENNRLYNCSTEEMASFNVPQPVIDKYGIDVCCGLLLQYTNCYSSIINRTQDNYINTIKEYVNRAKSNEYAYISRLKQDILFMPHDKDMIDYRLITHAYERSISDVEKRINKKYIQDDFGSLIKQIRVSIG